MEEIECICFDADFSLVKYRLNNFIRLEYTSVANCLIKLGYPGALLTTPYLNDIEKYVESGLIADFRTGYLLKISHDHTILRASYGVEMVDTDKLIEQYGNPPKYTLNDPEVYYVDNERWVFLTHFSLGGILAYGVGVELFKNQEMQLESFSQWAKDLKQAILMNYDTISGPSLDSFFYPVIYAAPDDYIVQQPEMRGQLQELRDRGIKLVVVTNSYENYTNFIFNHALGSDWHTFFDLIVVATSKPGFFKHEKEFIEESWENLSHLKGKLKKQGDADKLEQLIGMNKIMFVGDHYIGDVYAPKKFKNWFTAAVVPELYIEKGINSIQPKQSITAITPVSLSNGSLEYIERWGSHFGAEDNPSFWWDWVNKHADIVTPDVPALLRALIEREHN